MTREELEQRLETRMQNCEDALQQWPDSPAWLARYQELSEVRHLVQQLDGHGQAPFSILPDLTLEKDLLEIIHHMGQAASTAVVDMALAQCGRPARDSEQVIMALSRLCSQGLIHFYQDGMYRVRPAGLKALEGPTTGQEPDLDQDQGNQEKTSQEGSQAGPGNGSGPVPKRTQGKRSRDQYMGEQKGGKCLGSLSYISIRKAIMQALKEHPDGGDLGQVTNWVEEIMEYRIGVACVGRELENMKGRGVVTRTDNADSMGSPSCNPFWKLSGRGDH